MADELVDYNEEETVTPGTKGDGGADVKKGSYVGIHATTFKDLLLKPELMKAIVDCAFEHPSEGKKIEFPLLFHSHPCWKERGLVFIL